MRAGGRCEICNLQNDLEAHHIFFGSEKCDPITLYNPDFYACLCPNHHRYAPDAPHISNDTFLAVYLPIIDPDRAKAIERQLTAPYVKEYFDINKRHKELVEEFKEAEKTAWMDNL